MWFDPVKDARLPSDIVPPPERSGPAKHPEKILLTGATGFLGAFLLDELMRQTTATVYCLVRATDTEEAAGRVFSNMSHYRLWKPEYSVRVKAVVGDIEKARLGMAWNTYDELSGEVHRIFHSAARINHVLPYPLLKKTNVTATQEIIRLACRHRLKHVHFMSSTAACVGQGKGRVLLFPEERVHASPNSLVSAYGLSKWVAERTLENASKVGVPVSIFRGGDIAGDSRNGIGKTSDLFHLFFKLFVEVGKRPQPFSGEINILPVDFAAKAAIFLALRSDDETFRVFNLVHPAPMTVADLFDQIRRRGYPLESYEMDAWVQDCQSYIKGHYSRKEALVLRYLFRKESTGYLFQWYFRPYRFVIRNMAKYLDESSFACPPLDGRLWDTYFSRLLNAGFIQPPLVGGEQPAP